MTNSMPYDQCITLVRSVMFANDLYNNSKGLRHTYYSN